MEAAPSAGMSLAEVRLDKALMSLQRRLLISQVRGLSGIEFLVINSLSNPRPEKPIEISHYKMRVSEEVLIDTLFGLLRRRIVEHDDAGSYILTKFGENVVAAIKGEAPFRNGAIRFILELAYGNENRLDLQLLERLWQKIKSVFFSQSEKA